MLGLRAVGRTRIPRRREADDRRHDSKIGAALMETVVDKRRRALLREPRPCRYIAHLVALAALTPVDWVRTRSVAKATL
jgi:hypothetical protein